MILKVDSLIDFHDKAINSSLFSAAYKHQRTVPALLQVMACHLFSAKPLLESMLPCELDL